MDGGEVAYLRHAEVGVEENLGTLRCALHTGLWKSAVALRRESANRGMTFIQPLFGGRCACIGVTGKASQPRANILNRSSAVFPDGDDASRRWGNPMDGGRCGCAIRCVADDVDAQYDGWRGSGVPPARRGWCRGESRHATLRFAYRVMEECRRSATRECKPRDDVYTTALRR